MYITKKKLKFILHLCCLNLNNLYFYISDLNNSLEMLN